MSRPNGVVCDRFNATAGGAAAAAAVPSNSRDEKSPPRRYRNLLLHDPLGMRELKSSTRNLLVRSLCTVFQHGLKRFRRERGCGTFSPLAIKQPLIGSVVGSVAAL